MVAQRGMHGTVTRHAFVQSGRCKRQETALARTGHGEVPAIPRGEFLNIVDGTDATQHDALVVTLVAIVHAVVPIAVQSTVGKSVIDTLIHRDRDAVNTYFQHDNSLRSRPGVALIGPNACPRNTQKCRVFLTRGIYAVGINGHGQYTIGTRAPTHILETHLIDVHVLCRTLGQQPLGGLQRCPASLLDGFRPE